MRRKLAKSLLIGSSFGSGKTPVFTSRKSLTAIIAKTHLKSQLTDSQRKQLRGLICSAVYRVPELKKFVALLREHDDFELLMLVVITMAIESGSAKETAEFLASEYGICCGDLETVFCAIRNVGRQ